MNRKTREGFYTLWTLALLVCLVICLGVLIYVSVVGGSPAAETQPTPSSEGQPADGEAPPADGYGTADGADATPVPTEEPPASTVLAETEDMGQVYLDKIVFLGDSTTYGLYAYGVLPHTQVWTPASGTMGLFNWSVETIDYYSPEDPEHSSQLSIADAVKTRRPEYLVITLGINGVAILDESSFKSYYRDLIAAVQQNSPDTKIICQSIYPVIDAKTSGDIKNDRINAANQWINDVAAEMSVRYLNTHDALMDSTGNLIAEYDSGDGIHLLPAGLQIILQSVRTHGYR